MFKQFLISCLIIISSLNSYAADRGNGEVKLTALATDSDGSLSIFPTKAEAVEYCKSKGMRLPTAKELALYYRKFGSDVVFDRSQQKGDDIYQEETPLNPDGSIDHLFVSTAQYILPISHPESHFVWTSSAFITKNNETYYFFGYHGGVGLDLRLPMFADRTAARCVLNN